MVSPVISVGNRSGVNWIRLNFASKDFAKDFATFVFPVPGTSSKSTCPSANNAVKRDELPEDEEKMILEDIQESIGKYNKIVDEKLKEKEAELMHV